MCGWWLVDTCQKSQVIQAIIIVLDMVWDTVVKYLYRNQVISKSKYWFSLKKNNDFRKLLFVTTHLIMIRSFTCNDMFLMGWFIKWFLRLYVDIPFYLKWQVFLSFSNGKKVKRLTTLSFDLSPCPSLIRVGWTFAVMTLFW